MKATTVTYQIGVDILGFPLYLEHSIIVQKLEQQAGRSYIPKKGKPRIRVFEKFIKQH